MRHEASLIEDVFKLGESLIEAVLDTKQGLGEDLRQKAEIFATRFNLVRREEYDAAFAMLAKARNEQESLRERIESLEAKLIHASATKSKKKAPKTVFKKKDSRPKNLRSVKHGNRRKAP